MSYDDMKQHQGKPYTGMPVGASHHWIYPDGIWNEKKVAPDKWTFRFSATKERETAAPLNTGAATNSQYHWYIIANQRARKLDSNAYDTLMEGLKFKVGHKRPYWRQWNYEYPGQQTESERIIAILEDTLADLKKEVSQ